VTGLLRSVFAKTLWDHRRTWLGWGIGLLAVVLVYVGPFDQYREQGILDVDLDFPLYQALGFQDLASPEGYLDATVFGLLGPLLVIMAAVVAGARSIAGDEEAGTLDLLLAHPVSRTRVVVERFAALLVAMAWLGLIVWGATALTVRAADMGIPLDRVTAAAGALALLGLTFGTLALALGAVTGRRALVLGVTAAVAVAAYLANTLALQFEALEPARYASPFYHAFGADPLRTGFDPVGIGTLAALALVILAVAIWGFNRRDVAV
jgi:ABC-2 type transport system permease protein